MTCKSGFTLSRIGLFFRFFFADFCILLIYSWLYIFFIIYYILDRLQRYELILNIHQTMATIKDETESLGTMTQEQIGGLLAGFLAAHAVGITDAMVAGH